MPTSIPNFNFLARLVSEIWGGGVAKWKVGAPDFPRDPLADNFLYRALVRVNAYKCAKFQLPSSTSFRDKEGVPKFNVGATTPVLYTVRWNFCVCSRYLARSNSVPNFSIVSVCIMQLCEYVFPIGLPIWFPICAQKWGFWEFWGWRCENIVFWPQKALPCVNTRLLVYRMSESV